MKLHHSTIGCEVLEKFNGKRVELKMVSGKGFTGLLTAEFRRGKYCQLVSLIITKDDGTIAAVDENGIDWINEQPVGESK